MSASIQAGLNYTKNLLYNSALDSIAYSGVYAAAAIAAQFFFPLFAAPLALSALSVYLANAALNLLKDWQSIPVKQFLENTFEVFDSFQKKWPYVLQIIMVSALVISLFSLALGSIAIITYSILNAVKISIQKNMENNNVIIQGPIKTYAYLM